MLGNVNIKIALAVGINIVFQLVFYHIAYGHQIDNHFDERWN